jgi:hypothetical protein
MHESGRLPTSTTDSLGVGAPRCRSCCNCARLSSSHSAARRRPSNTRAPWCNADGDTVMVDAEAAACVCTRAA